MFGCVQVHSPVALTEECRRALASIGGQVSHIVVPSLAPQHWCEFGGFHTSCPVCIAWLRGQVVCVVPRACPISWCLRVPAGCTHPCMPGTTLERSCGFRQVTHVPSACSKELQGITQRLVSQGLVEMNEEFEALENFGMVELKQLVEARPRILGYSVPPAWRADIETAMFICPMYVEAAFCMKNFGVLVTSDLCFGTETQKSRQNQKDDRGWWAAVTQMPFKVTIVPWQSFTRLVISASHGHQSSRLHHCALLRYVPSE